MKTVCYFYFFILMVFTFSCNESSGDALLDLEGPNAKLELSNAKEIGDLHNQYLEKLFANFDFSNDNYFSQLENNYLKIVQTEFYPNIGSEILKKRGIDEFKAINSWNPKTKHIVLEAVGLIYKGLHYDIIETEITKLEDDLEKLILTADEFNTTLTTLEVLKSSANFWLPVSRDGNGKGYEILINIAYKGKPMKKKRELDCVDSVIVADGLTAGTGMIVSAFAAALAGGPVGAAAFFGWVGIRAAVASGTAALLNCGPQE